jgi:hypothetical protein
MSKRTQVKIKVCFGKWLSVLYQFYEKRKEKQPSVEKTVGRVIGIILIVLKVWGALAGAGGAPM